MSVKVTIDAEKALAVLRDIERDVQGRAMDVALSQGGLVLARATQEKLTESGRHSPGTPTPAAPGQPPAIITSDLRASVKVTDPEGSFGKRYVRVGPTMEYARIQELGGGAIPARPYLKPAVEKNIGRAREAVVDALRRFL